MNPTAPAEHLLDLAIQFTRHNDDLARLRVTLARHGLSGSSPATALTDHAAFTQRLANAALDIVEVLKAQPMYLSPAIRTVYARVWQLAYLVSDSTDHLLDAVNIIDDARAAIPGPTGVPLSHKEALGEAGRRVDLVRDLTALGGGDAVATAELYVTDRRRWGVPPPHQPPSLSPTQHAALRAVAQGEVTIANGKPHLHRDGIRLSISTIRSPESSGLVTRAPCPLLLHDERIHLTPDGRRGLTATFGRQQALKPTTTRPAARPATRTARAPTR
ncbi:hypothetical protein GCM10010400_46730 [Streptomyces aculeolatus]|uniref:hypothetical protein n=1 Tax=Streptomyces aculeolatus TaxID=270689 RepID=UPI001CECDA2E|nr:hypothetical protein [Streptomyces aculeolatus]